MANIRVIPNVDESEVAALQRYFASRASCDRQSESYISPGGGLALALTYEGELRFGPAFFSAEIKTRKQGQNGEILSKLRFRKFLSPGCCGQKFDYWAGDPWSGDEKHLALVEVKTSSRAKSKALIFNLHSRNWSLLREFEGILAHGMWSQSNQYYLYKDFRNWYRYCVVTEKNDIVFQGASFPRHCYFVGKEGLILLMEDSYKLISPDSLSTLSLMPFEEEEIKANRYSLYDPINGRVFVGVNPTFPTAGMHVRCEKWKAIVVD